MRLCVRLIARLLVCLCACLVEFDCLFVRSLICLWFFACLGVGLVVRMLVGVRVCVWAFVCCLCVFVSAGSFG